MGATWADRDIYVKLRDPDRGTHNDGTGDDPKPSFRVASLQQPDLCGCLRRTGRQFQRQGDFIRLKEEE